MSPSRLVLLSVLMACGARGELGSSLRGSGAASPASPETKEGQVIGCSCAMAGACQCNPSESSSHETEESRALAQLVLERTKELSAWWQSQNETTRLSPWSGPLVNQTSELWVAGGGWHAGGIGVGGIGGGCRRGGGCACTILGCGCAGRRGCAAWR